MKSILVPVDFSRASRAGLELALEFAGQLGASITLLHVYGLPMPEFASETELGSSLLERVAAACREGLDRLRQEVEDRGAEVRTICAHGSPADEIVKRARGGFDLVVMGTNGRTGVSHALIGSVAERVTRLCPCPVLTVRA